ncbi:NAD(P)H-hydrate dehydratase [Eubacteriales bacterium OttesenSCG-928-M02]|nr:NAD(P)H-hydrate dehydratase [Eubacteriales bacterium OttesenSCG-928-M02]
MKNVFLSEDIRLMDNQEAAKRGGELELVELSGYIVASRIRRLVNHGPVLFFCGPGNNGGDGIAAALLLEKEGIETKVCLVGARLKPSTLVLWGRYMEQNPLGALQTIAEGDIHAFANRTTGGVLAVDALLGTGARFGLVGAYRAAAEVINGLSGQMPVLAVDIPTGVCGDTGRADPASVRANETICLTGYKAGVLLYPGAAYAGKVHTATVFESDVELARHRYLFTGEDMLSLHRNRNTHKGSYGRLCIIGGSPGMPGAALLSAQAALRSGVGTVTLATTGDTVALYTHRITEAMAWSLPFDHNGDLMEEQLLEFIQGRTAVVLGPGLGTGAWVYQAVGCALRSGIPALFDADGLNAISRRGTRILEEATIPPILTPHPMELSRLMETNIENVLNDPILWVERASQRFSAIILLKGSTSVVADGRRTVFINRGTAGMAKGGSGDVLSGIIGSFMAMGYPLEYAVWAGAYCAGRAGEYAAAEYGTTYMLPTDTIGMLYKVYKEMEK